MRNCFSFRFSAGLFAGSSSLEDGMKTAMAAPYEIEALIQRARDGDRNAWEGAVVHFRDPLEAHIRKRIGNHLRQEVDLDDVFQESLAQATRSLSHCHAASAPSFLAWLKGIAEHVILNLARRKRGDKILYVEEDAPSAEPTPSKHHRRGERMDRLQRSLESLKPEYREVVTLVRIEGLPIREAAGRMGRTPKAVAHLLGRALAKLKEAFGDTESLSLPRDRGIHGGEGHGA